MENLNFEIEVRYACEGYPHPGESVEAVIERGDFQPYASGVLVRWRTYELVDGEVVNPGPWHEAKPIKVAL